jgi:hypothetical protein
LSDASLDTGAGSVVQVSGNRTPTVTLDLSGVEDAQALTLRLHNVTTNQSSADLTLPMRVLIGDVNGDGTVNSADALLTRKVSGQSADQTSFRADLNVDGAINSADAVIVRSRSGNFLDPVRVSTRNPH